MSLLPVLYVEDEPNDAFLVGLSFKRANVAAPLTVVSDGREAIEYLSGVGPYADRHDHPLPCLVLLDLNLPVVSGFDTLKWIRSQPPFKEIPIVVFSSSAHPNDAKRARELGANDYLCKPVDMAHMQAIVLALRQRWLAHQAPRLDL